MRGWRIAGVLAVLGLGCQATGAGGPEAPAIQSAEAVAVDPTAEPAEVTPHEVTGIGIRPASHSDGFAIGQLFPGGPAAEAGLRAGDVIVAVDGEPTARWTLDRVARRLRSTAGTKVSLVVVRGADRFEVQLLRRVVAVPPLH